MENITEYIQAELLILIPVLYLIGAGLKKTNLIADKLIPIVIGLAGIVLATIYVLAVNDVDNWRQLLTALFTSITQGVLVAGASVYCNQLYKQITGK
jgi:hypothetical protein